MGLFRRASPAARILVITSCTGEKLVGGEGLLVEDFDDAERLRKREKQLSRSLRPAGDMYTGQQHVRAMRGVRDLRSVLGTKAVDVVIVSAGYGLIVEERPIAPYNITFSGMAPSAIRARGRRLGVPAALRGRLPEHEVVFCLLGSSYLPAVEPPLPRLPGQQIVYFAKPGERLLATAPGVLVPAGKAEATLYGAGLVALKGRMLELLGVAVKRDGRKLLEAIRADDTAASVVAALMSVRAPR
jgi:hypothetical protein